MCGKYGGGLGLIRKQNIILNSHGFGQLRISKGFFYSSKLNDGKECFRLIVTDSGPIKNRKMVHNMLMCIGISYIRARDRGWVFWIMR